VKSLRRGGRRVYQKVKNKIWGISPVVPSQTDKKGKKKSWEEKKLVGGWGGGVFLGLLGKYLPAVRPSNSGGKKRQKD